MSKFAALMNYMHRILGLLLLLIGAAVSSVGAATAPEQATSPAQLSFAQETYTVLERAGTATITIRRTGNTNEAAKCSIDTVEGTAAKGRDFILSATEVVVPAGKQMAQVDVRILDDMVKETSKTVTLLLSNPGEGTSLGEPRTAELEILDDDASRTAWFMFGLNQIGFMNRTVFDIPLYQYLASLIFVLLAFLGAKLVDYLLHVRLRAYAAKTATRWDDVLLNLLHGPIKIVTWVILLHIGLRVFPWPEWVESLLSTGLKLVVAISLTLLALRLVDVLCNYWRERSMQADDLSVADQLVPIVRNIMKVVLGVLAVILTLQNIGVNVTSLVASISIGGLAVGLAAQDTVANFFGAVVVLLDKPFRVGDQIKLDIVEGTVEAIGLRSTRVRTAEGHVAAIPNRTVGNAIVINYASRPQIRTVLNVVLAADTPLEQVQSAVESVEQVFRSHTATKDLVVSLNKYDAALNIQVTHVWRGGDPKQHLQDMQRLHLQVKNRLEAQAIKLAGPVQTVLVKREGRTTSSRVE